MTLFLITFLGFALSCGATRFLHFHGEDYPQGPPDVRLGNMWNEWNNDNRFWRHGDRRMNRNNPAFNGNFVNRGFGSGFDWNARPIFSNQAMPPPVRIRPVIEDLNDSNNFYTSYQRFTTMSPSTSTAAIPGQETTRTPCENLCSATSQFDPVCGNNGVTYTNMQWFNCALRCGRNLKIKNRGSCPRPM